MTAPTTGQQREHVVGVSPGQRRERILAELYERRHVTAKDLAEVLGTSEATVRRDLKGLAGSGQIELVYGGATLRRLADYSFRSKAMRSQEAKQIIGGQYRSDRMDTIGPLATATLEQLHGYLCFIGADGLSLDHGPTAADIESASLYRLAVRNARRTILLVDHTKFLTTSLCKIVDWSAIAQVVTDRPPPPPWDTFFPQRDIDVVCGPAADHESSRSDSA
jgi:DeoR/GlpR family transcriptional regulator of sugar metabolism